MTNRQIKIERWWCLKSPDGSLLVHSVGVTKIATIQASGGLAHVKWMIKSKGYNLVKIEVREVK